MSAPIARRRAVVVGGAGFIGSTLVDRLLADDWEVVAIDSFESFYPRRVKEHNLQRATMHPRFRLLEVDSRERESITAAIVEAQPEVVVDLAARAGVRPSLSDPQLYIDINVKGLKYTLDAVAEAGARFVFASSSSVYGDDPRQPFAEDQMLCRPESPYGATKIAGEALVNAHHATTGLPVAIARLFTVFGPRQRPDLAIHKFARRMLAHEPIDLYDEGRALRDYTYVQDVVDAFVRMIDGDGRRLLVNIGSHRPIATSDLVDILEQALGVTAERRLMPAQVGDVPATYADISRATQELGWEPSWRFEDGIAAFCDWLRDDQSRGSHDLLPGHRAVLADT